MSGLNATVAGLPTDHLDWFRGPVAGSGVISLSMGEPGYPTPGPIWRAACRALAAGETGYAPGAGLPALRRQIALSLAARYAVNFDPERAILVTSGVSEGLDLAFRTLLAPGEEALIPDPGYVAYGHGIRLAGGRPVPVPTHGEDGFRLHPEAVATRITPRSRVIVLCSPNNPTGTVQSRNDMAAIARIAAHHDLFLISDEIYDRLIFQGQHTCVAGLPDAVGCTLLLNGFSKTYAMAGWRVGYACGPASVIEAMRHLHQITMACVSQPAQHAALAALLGCVVYPDLHKIVFSNLDWLVLADLFIMPTFNMVLAARSDVGTITSAASHPAPCGLIPDHIAVRHLVTSNAEAARVCASGQTDACITTLPAAYQNGLVVLRDFGPVPMGFSIHVPVGCE